MSSVLLVTACGGRSTEAEETQAVGTGAQTDIGDTGIGPLEPPAEIFPPLRVELPAEGFLGSGSQSEDVEVLQRALDSLGYEPGAADGFFGPSTRKAVIAFQRDRKLQADGIVGSKTAEAMNEALEELASQASMDAG